MATELCTPHNNLGWLQPDEELLGMEEMTTPVEDKILDEMIPSFADELSSLTTYPVEDLRNWKNSFLYDKVDTRIAVKYALMKLFFEDMLQESFGGAYDRHS